MTTTVTVQRKDFLEALQAMRLIDDTFFNSCFDGQADCMQNSYICTIRF